MLDRDFRLKIQQGYKVTTLQIIYYLPDYTSLLQEFMWQYLDLQPRYPRTQKFLIHWHKNIDAVIKEVNLSQSEQISPTNYRAPKGFSGSNDRKHQINKNSINNLRAYNGLYRR